MNKTFRQLDGSDIKYTNWANGRPLSDKIDSNCVGLSADEISFGKWIDENCLKKNAILCQKLQTWSLSKLQSVLMDVRKNQIDIIQNPVPIEFIYVQLNGQSEPTQLWLKNKWKNVSAKYAGLFFRVEGGQSGTFGQIQEQ